MTRLAIVALVVAVACTGHAGGNPDVRIYIDFDPPNYVHEIQPEIYTPFEAYVCLDNVVDGITCVSFRMNDPLVDCAGVSAVATWVPLFMS